MGMNKGKQCYNERLKTFLREIEELAAADARQNPMHAIMDTVPFKDLEIALMMARMECGGQSSGAASKVAA